MLRIIGTLWSVDYLHNGSVIRKSFPDHLNEAEWRLYASENHVRRQAII